jgi:hypothetical protein
VNIFALIVVVACLFNTTAFGMTRAEKDRPENIFVYLEDEIDPKKENDLIKVTVNLIGDAYDCVAQIQYELGVGMVYTPFKNTWGGTLNSKLDNGVVTFYRGGLLPADILSIDQFLSNASFKVTGYLYVRASWDREYKLYEMFQKNSKANNYETYAALYEHLTRKLNHERDIAVMP